MELGFFDYKISSGQMATIITFQGKICKESLEKLERCRGDLSGLPSRLYIIYFKDVPAVDHATFRELTLLQQEIRKRALLFVVGLRPELKGLLTDKAIIRPNEIKKSLEEALKVPA